MKSTPPPDSTSRPRRRALRRLLSPGNPAGTVYGTVTIGALLAAESGLRDTYPETVGSLVLAVLLYWFTHSYADLFELRLSERRLPTWGELWGEVVQDWAIVIGALAPVSAVLIGWAAGATQASAVTAGTWAAVVSLIALELIAGLRSRARAPELILQVTIGGALGVAILVLRALLH